MLVLSYKKQTSKKKYIFKLYISQKDTFFQARERLLLLLQISSLCVQLLMVVKSKRDVGSVPAQESTTAQVQTYSSSLHIGSYSIPFVLQSYIFISITVLFKD